MCARIISFAILTYMKKPIIYICIGICVLGAIYASYSMLIARPEVPTKIIHIDSERVEENNEVAYMTNPASLNCKEKGGISKIETKEDGSQYGLCMFEENRACEEWALLREDCPIGGRKTTGYDTIDQKYCAWSGGTTTATANSICTFKNGKTCPTIDFYKGTCAQ